MTASMPSPIAALRASLSSASLLGFAAKGSDAQQAQGAFVGYRNSLTVTSTADSGAGSLRAELAQNVTDGGDDQITFAPSIAGQTINLQSTLTITAPVTIDGGGAVTVSGQNNVGVFDVAVGDNNFAQLLNLTIANGASTGAAGASGAIPPNANANNLNGGPGGDAAGGIFVQSGQLNVFGDNFVNDTATGGAGGSGGYTAGLTNKGAGGAGGNAAGAVYVEPGAAVANAQNLGSYNDTATAGVGGGSAGGPAAAGVAYPVSNNSTVTSNTTALAAACYCTGTLIRTASGDVAVEDLKVGDLVVTASGARRPIRWIGHRSYAGRFANCNPVVLPICFMAGALEDGVPARDLWVSPKHAMFMDGALVPAEFLVNGVSVIKATRVERVEYWHVELDSHDVLIAEGAPSESFVDDNSRGMFHNAPAFWAANPEAIGVAAMYCAPRLEDGYQLEAIRRAMAARAGIADAAPDCGTLHGYIDAIEGGVVRGWARSALNPAMAVCLDLVIDGRVVATGLANRRRADLDAAGYGPHGFAFAIPPGTEGKPIEIRRSADGARMKLVLDRAA